MLTQSRQHVVEKANPCVHLYTTCSVKVQAAAEVLDALTKMGDPQVCLRLMRSCLGFCKMGYLMRTVPWEAQSRATGRL